MDRISEKDPYKTEMKSNKELYDMQCLIADGDYGLPLTCPCGGSIIGETTTEAPIGRRYFTCNVFKNDGLHIRKFWVHAIEEEVTKLRTEFDAQSKEGSFGLHELMIKQLRRELENNAEEIANLKELMARLVSRMEKLFGPMP